MSRLSKTVFSYIKLHSALLWQLAFWSLVTYLSLSLSVSSLSFSPPESFVEKWMDQFVSLAISHSCLCMFVILQSGGGHRNIDTSEDPACVILNMKKKNCIKWRLKNIVKQFVYLLQRTRHAWVVWVKRFIYKSTELRSNTARSSVYVCGIHR